jgi:hypothetical protein
MPSRAQKPVAREDSASSASSNTPQQRAPTPALDPNAKPLHSLLRPSRYTPLLPGPPPLETTHEEESESSSVVVVVNPADVLPSKLRQRQQRQQQQQQQQQQVGGATTTAAAQRQQQRHKSRAVSAPQLDLDSNALNAAFKKRTSTGQRSSVKLFKKATLPFSSHLVTSLMPARLFPWTPGQSLPIMMVVECWS